MQWIVETFRRHFYPLEPLRPDCGLLNRFGEEIFQKPAWTGQIRAVLFDLYGTLWISSTAQLEQLRNPYRVAAVRETLETVGVRPDRWSQQEADLLFALIEAMHAQRRAEGIDYPEISMVEAWQQFLHRLADSGWVDREQIGRLDAAYLVVVAEAKANPLWPMPGAEQTVNRLRQAGYRLGIVSNAQFYTPYLFQTLFGRAAEELGFESELTFYSYVHGIAKPSLALFHLAQQALAQRRIRPWETLHVGNDMLHDIWPAHQVGFRTALFAGDQRSLRLRDEEPQVQNLRPDVVLTSLTQLADWLTGPQ